MGLALVLILSSLNSASGLKSMTLKKPRSHDLRDVERTKEKYEKKLLTLANVVGVGIGYKTIRSTSTHKLCIKVYVEKKLPESKISKGQLIPKRIENVETDVEQAGEIKALLTPDRQTAKISVPKEISDKIIELILKYKAPEKIVIFGSRVSGNFKDTSDIDIAIFGRGWTDTDINLVRHSLNQEIKTSLKFDVLNFYQIGKEGLKENILKKGQTIYDRGKN